MLCYIFLLHQTTTGKARALGWLGCVISFFYIKPQPMELINKFKASCVISFFYIKPQQLRVAVFRLSVVLYLSSTSNHN